MALDPSAYLFAGLRVRDFPAALPWYERLLGEPTSFPLETEAVWILAEHRAVYLVQHAAGGASVAFVMVGDLDGQIGAVQARGLEPTERQTLSNGVRKAIYRDPEGNEFQFGAMPLADAR